MSEKANQHGDMLAFRYLPAPLYVLRGALFIWTNRVLWKYAASPLLISVVVLGIAYALLYYFFFSLVGQFIGGEWYWQIPAD